ncbi:MAG TPA: hypothetical protein VI461_00690, partial [Chitinophagaceae bacterium]|nr:hypothetical protein [Chitinophagaceae bacterium]
MPINEFEKQVQKKMDEFRPEPSASVWQKVEVEIRKKKRRRIIFFFILPAAVALTALSVYYFTNNTPKDKIAQEQNASSEKKSENAGNDKMQEQPKRDDNVQPPTTIEETDLSKVTAKTTPKNTISTDKAGAEATSANPVINRRKNIPAGNG